MATGGAAANPISGAESWQMWGSCRRLAPEVFYPEDGGRRGLQAREEQAKQICRRCPVVTDCRNHALSARETYGVWGAMSARDRQREFAARREPVIERS